jgi:hypothetical protein
MEIENPDGKESGIPVVFCSTAPEGKGDVGEVGVTDTGGNIAGQTPIKYL